MFQQNVSHHQAFFKNANTESLKLHQDGDLPCMLKYVMNVYKCVRVWVQRS